MIKSISGWGMEEKVANCFAEKECKFYLIRWTEQAEATMFGGDKEVQLSLLCEDKDIEFIVGYKVKDEDKKDEVFEILTKFLEEVDGQKIDLNDYINCHINDTKFPIIEGVERVWVM